VSDPVAALDGFFCLVPDAVASRNADVSKTLGITIKKGAPMSEALAAMLIAGMQPEAVAALGNPSALTKARHLLRHETSGKFVPAGSGGVTPSAQSSAPPPTYPEDGDSSDLPGSAKPKTDWVVPKQGEGWTLFAHGGAVVPLLRKLRRGNSLLPPPDA
jgi:hypothetical protein